MRIVDYRWSISVTGLPGVTTFEQFKDWAESKHIGAKSFITFCGSAYPSTVLGFKQMVFKAVVNIGNDTATLSLTTNPGDLMADLNNPTIAFETAIEHIKDAGMNEYNINYIVPVSIANANRATTLVCF